MNSESLMSVEEFNDQIRTITAQNALKGAAPIEELDGGYQIKLVAQKDGCKCVCLYKKQQKVFADINWKTYHTVIHPLRIPRSAGSTDFLESRYNIKFVLEGYSIYVKSGMVDNQTANELSGLPDVFTIPLRFGLGFKKEFRSIMDVIKQHFSECDTIVLSGVKETNIKDRELTINSADLENLRKGIRNIHRNFLDEAYLSKTIFVHTEVFHKNNPERFPEQKKAANKEVTYRLLKNTDFTKSKTSDNDKQILSACKDAAELSYLQVLAKEFSEKVNENHKEGVFQKFFENNTFLLTIFAGSPYVKFKNQAYVGGKSFDNSGGKYPDFLLKHKATNNTFIVEIKTPNTELMEKTSYREDVFSPSEELSGTISQVLSQKYSLETEIATLIKNAEDRDVEAYNVQCLIIIGRIEELEKNKKRSFELFRNNQKNVKIITYDECLMQLESLIEILSNKTLQDKSPAEEED